MRLYSVQEARALIPEIVPLLGELRDLVRTTRAEQQAVAAARRGAMTDGSDLGSPWPSAERDRQASLQAREKALERIREYFLARDIEIKDPETGLIDFYHQREGEIVYLCYRLGEAELAYWHTLEGGFAGRRPL